MAPAKGGCFHLLGCAGVAADDDPTPAVDGAGLPSEESKAFSDKGRWSFRRRSTRHRSFKNTEISEPDVLSSNKGNCDAANNFCSPQYSYSCEKTSNQEKSNERTNLQLREVLSADKTPEVETNAPSEPLYEEKRDLHDPAVQVSNRHDPAAQVTNTLNVHADEESTMVEPADEESTMVEPDDEESSMVEPDDEESTMVEPANEENTMVEPVADEKSSNSGHDTAVIVIQSSVRMFLARQELQNHRRFVKLQATIRGHLVRRQAFESLRCLLAIIKLQALIRAHKAQVLLEKSPVSADTFFQVKSGSLKYRAMHVSSTSKLLSNAFASKVMGKEVLLKNITTKCDLKSSDSTWKWLETWSSLVPQYTGDQFLESKEAIKLDDTKIDDYTLSGDSLVLSDSCIEEKLVTEQCDGTLNALDSLSSESSALVSEDFSSQPEKGNLQVEHIAKSRNHDDQDAELTLESAVEENYSTFSDQKSVLSDQSREITPSDVPESYCNANLHNVETTDTESKKSVGKKQCNPAFAAAQSKFEELSSASSVSRSTTFPTWEGRGKQNQNNVKSTESASKSDDASLTLPTLTAGHPKVVTAASECGTEISISSTLDSPERSEVEGGEIVIEIGTLESQTYVNGDIDCNTAQTEEQILDNSISQIQKVEQENTNLDDSVPLATAELDGRSPPMAEPAEHAPSEAIEADQDDLEKPAELPTKVPVDGTPRSQATVADSCGTPSSEVSVNTRKARRENNLSSHKPKPQLSTKHSFSSPKSDSIGRSSTDNLQKDMKKRESSTRAARSDSADSEPRVSNSTPLPSYMQFTESARAKTSANVSPKASPDVQDQPSRKRLSGPLSNGKQDSSPRMQRSSSQAQQASKGNNGSATSADRRWQI